MQPLEAFDGASADYLEELYALYQRDPWSIDRQWAEFFSSLDGAPPKPALEPQRPASPPAVAGELANQASDLVHSYRELGHCIAQIDPLGQPRPPQPLLELAEFGLSEADLDRQVGSGSFLGPVSGTLRSLIEQLQATYCRTLGVEYMEITDKEQRTWLQERMEPILNRPQFTADQSRRILEQLIAAETFEKFLHLKFPGQKRFSVEGAESVIPLLDTLIEEGAALGIEEVVMGMAHRGRLNVLAHIVHKPYEIILSEFLGTAAPQTPESDDDVKYHLGYSHDRVTARGHKIHTSLSYNPSHLELIDPVIEGMVRAKQQRRGDRDHIRVVPILIHGEAAFTGQGIVSETLALSQLAGYRTGGTIHVIINNQVGFTATPQQTRFTPYPTDVAKMIQAPIFHVNGDDPEAVVHAAGLAVAFRQRFRVDVMIDLWCYRRHGHNEADDATFTQPLMYRKIAQHPSVATIYARRLEEEGRIAAQEPQQIEGQVRQRLDHALERAKELHPRQRIFSLGGLWKGLERAPADFSADTAVPRELLAQITEKAANLPAEFALHPKLKRLFEARSAMIQGKRPVDWSCAEMWALGSLLLEGTAVRLTGQDTERGTFGHRHAVLHDFQRGTRYIPLQHLAENQAQFLVVNTMLSELGVLGFEYGYSSADPWTLVIWEAQFGDFANGAQPVIDQFIASAESKWQRMSGIVLLLPHGYEGQGPEHSSARLERFLQLCAENNMQVCYPTQPSQYFHLLRRQMRRKFRKPLIVMAPKSLLRDELSTSPLDDFTRGSFQTVLDDPSMRERDRVKRLVLCSGRIFFTLHRARQQRECDQIALVRVEQLYPFPRQEIQSVIARYARTQEVYWVQEEPRNMGAWAFMEPRLEELLPQTCVLSYHGRREAASPATGSFRLHEVEEQAIVRQVFEGAVGTSAAAPPPRPRQPQPQGVAVP